MKNKFNPGDITYWKQWNSYYLLTENTTKDNIEYYEVYPLNLNRNHTELFMIWAFDKQNVLITDILRDV